MQRNTFHPGIVHHQFACRPSLPERTKESSAVDIGRDPSCYSQKWSTHLHYRAALRARQSGYDQFIYPSPRRTHLLWHFADTVLSAAGRSPKIRAQIDYLCDWPSYTTLLACTCPSTFANYGYKTERT